MKNKVMSFENVDGCFICTSHKYDSVGYLRMEHVRGKKFNLHRYLFEHAYGPIGDDVIHHLCENRTCLNVAHMVRMSRSDHFKHHRKNMDVSLNWIKNKVTGE